MSATGAGRAPADRAGGGDGPPVVLTFDDNRLLAELFGPHNAHLVRLERLLGVEIAGRGNEVAISGPAAGRGRACQVLNTLWARLTQGASVEPRDIDAAVRFAAAGPGAAGTGTAGMGVAGPAATGAVRQADGAAVPIIRTRRRLVEARTPAQGAYMTALDQSALVFALGPAGTGKTYLAVAYGVALLALGSVRRLVLSRPAVEAGERLGFLPGDLKEKVDPYLRPLYDALFDTLPADHVHRSLDNGTIEVAPLAFMRGRTLDDAFIILDEAQNTTSMQMRMFLTRLGRDSRMVVTGDPTQIDLAPGVRSGLMEAVEILQGVEGVATLRFEDADVVRHPLVRRIVGAYRRLDEGRRAAAERGSPA